MSFHVVVYKSKRNWNNADMCHSLIQKTSFSTDFKTIQEKRDNTLNQVNASVELLELTCLILLYYHNHFTINVPCVHSYSHL